MARTRAGTRRRGSIRRLNPCHRTQSLQYFDPRLFASASRQQRLLSQEDAGRTEINAFAVSFPSEGNYTYNDVGHQPHSISYIYPGSPTTEDKDRDETEDETETEDGDGTEDGNETEDETETEDEDKTEE